MLRDLLRELSRLCIELIQRLTLLKYLEVLLFVRHLCLLCDLLLNVLDEILHSIKRCFREIFAGWSVLLDAFKVFDRLLGIDALLVDDRFKLVVLFVYLFHNLFLDAFLAFDGVRHF